MKITIYVSLLVLNFIIITNRSLAYNTPAQCAQYVPLVEQYDWNTQIAVSIMFGESTCDETAHNASSTTHDDSYSLFQINLYGKLAESRPSAEWLAIPANNIAYAYKLYSTPIDPASTTDTRILGFTPWINQLTLALKGL